MNLRAGGGPVAQTSKSAVSRISKSADATPGEAAAGLETGDTADWEICATSAARLHPRNSAREDTLFFKLIHYRLVGAVVVA